ncbi:MAG: hypothetical protein KDC00_01120, partial [Flavobacteriales bacterium]|nr:hypothetical protein [Flavobacteriales bacterium]
MREKNPIDDRFKEALYHAEVEPPAALRNAVMARLDASAGPRPIGGIWPTALLLVGLVGAGTAISSWNGFGDPVAEQPTDLGSEFPAPLPVRSVKARDPGNIMDSRLGTDKNSAQPSTSQGPGDAGTGGERVADHRTNTLT